MTLGPHLTDEEIAKAAEGEGTLGTHLHQKDCVECRNKISAVQHGQAEEVERRETSKDKLRDILEEDLGDDIQDWGPVIDEENIDDDDD